MPILTTLIVGTLFGGSAKLVFGSLTEETDGELSEVARLKQKGTELRQSLASTLATFEQGVDSFVKTKVDPFFGLGANAEPSKDPYDIDFEEKPAEEVTPFERKTAELRESLNSAVATFEDEYQQFFKTKIDPLFSAQRDAQLKDIVTSEDPQIGPYERYINRNLGISAGVTLAAIATASLNPIIGALLVIPPSLYAVQGIYKLAYKSLVKDRKLSLPVLSAINVTGIFLGGYFVTGGLILFLIHMGMKVAYITEDRSHKRLVDIFGQQPISLWVLRDGVEVEIPFGKLQVGDILVIRAGQMVAADGVIVEGNASIDQRLLTGESQPVEMGVGDQVLAATVVLAGDIRVRVEKAGKETVAAKIGEMLEKTASYQMDITGKAYRIAEQSIVPTLVAAGLALTTVGYSGMVAITSTIFGFNLRISGPMALLNYLNIASRRSILVKDGRSLEQLKTVDTVIFDKTGTLTLERPHVVQVHVFADLDASDVLRYAAAVEFRQTHPIAQAILAHAEACKVTPFDTTDIRYEIGYGLYAEIGGNGIRVGSDRFMTQARIALPPQALALQAQSHAQGRSVVMVAMEDRLIGAIELEPTIRPEAKAVIDELRERGLEIYIISGDQEGPTRQLAETLGITKYYSNTLPENKALIVEQLQQEGRAVCFVGDGINDSIALKKANVSVSLRGATSVATDTAQVVLMDATLQQLPLLFKLAEELDENLERNLYLAIVPGLGIWAGVFFFHLGILGAAVIYESSIWAGIGSAFLPLHKYRQTENRN